MLPWCFLRVAQNNSQTFIKMEYFHILRFFAWVNFLWNALKYIFDLLNDRTRRIKINQNPHWKNNFSLLMTQLFMFDQTRASQSWDLLRPSRPAVVYNCVTQLMLYTGDKLSSPIFCLWVSECVRHRCHPTKSPLFPIYTGIQALCWPSTT